MENEEKKTYRLVCYYVGSKFESSTRIRARNFKDALQWAENYYTTICMTIKKIEVYDTADSKLVHFKNYAG